MQEKKGEHLNFKRLNVIYPYFFKNWDCGIALIK